MIDDFYLWIYYLQKFKSQSFLCENAIRSGILQNWIIITYNIGLNAYLSKGNTVYLSKRVLTNDCNRLEHPI